MRKRSGCSRNHTVDYEGPALNADEARPLLGEFHEHQLDAAVIYRHRWEPDMAVVWDNRSVLHRATGGYEGHDRLLRRTTIVR